MTITKVVSKCARGMNKQLLKTSGTDVLSSRKRFRKKLWGLASFPPPSPALYVQGLIFNHSYLYPSKVPVSVPFGFPAVSVRRGVNSVRHFSTSCCYLLISMFAILTMFGGSGPDFFFFPWLMKSYAILSCYATPPSATPLFFRYFYSWRQL